VGAAGHVLRTRVHSADAPDMRAATRVAKAARMPAAAAAVATATTVLRPRRRSGTQNGCQRTRRPNEVPTLDFHDCHTP
jgi:hypothetical protein